METLIPLIVQAVSGMFGGGIVGSLVKAAGMALLPKLISGALGGLAGGSILGSLLGGGVDPATATAAAGSGFDWGSLLTQAVGGLGGGGILTGIVGAVMSAIKK